MCRGGGLGRGDVRICLLGHGLGLFMRAKEGGEGGETDSERRLL